VYSAAYVRSMNGQQAASSVGVAPFSSRLIRSDGSAAWYPRQQRSASIACPTGCAYQKLTSSVLAATP